MRLFGFIWGIAGVIAILVLAVLRLSPYIGELAGQGLGPLHWAAMAGWTLYMAYAEGYKGFHLAFAPRVVARADFLRRNRRPLLSLLAPLFCMGYFHATRRRIITSVAVTTGIVCLVLLVRLLPQPWRGIVDTGVVTGLALGVGSIVYFTLRALLSPERFSFPADLPPAEDDNVSRDAAAR